MTLADRFWPKVDKEHPTGCHVWTGAKDAAGYGLIWDTPHQRLAHRVAYELTHGPIPPGLMILHSCHRPECVNPDHLRAGTAADNMHDKVLAGRQGPVGRKPGATTREAVLIWGLRLAGFTQKAIAERMGVTVQTVRNVLSGRTWRDCIDHEFDRPTGGATTNDDDHQQRRPTTIHATEGR